MADQCFECFGCSREFKVKRQYEAHLQVCERYRAWTLAKSEANEAQAEVVECNAAGLVGKDELGLKSILDGFKHAPNAQVEKELLAMAGYDSAWKVDGGFVRLLADDFVVLAHFEPLDRVFLIWVAEDGEERTFTNASGKEITFRPKRLAGWLPTGSGDEGIEEGRKVLSEMREGVTLQSMRAIEGFGVGTASGASVLLDLATEQEADDEDAFDEMRSLMEE